jgi:hypothetical protein
MSVWLGGQDDAMRPDWWGPNARSLDRAGPAYQIKRVMVETLPGLMVQWDPYVRCELPRSECQDDMWALPVCDILKEYQIDMSGLHVN